jgi:predicted amidohydrolase YtcJ
MILENGLIRTLDPSLPTARALAIAGDRIVGGVGVHEWALPTPERVDLQGRCVVPGFVDSHVHFLSWSLAQTMLRLDGCGDLRELTTRVAGAAQMLKPGEWLVGRGWREGDWPEGQTAHRDHLDSVSMENPVALVARDGHSLWLNSAALAHAEGEIGRIGDVVERSIDGAPTGVLREQAAWAFQDRFVQFPSSQVREAMRKGLRLANARGVTAIHDQDGARGILSHWQGLKESRLLSARVWQSLPISDLEGLAALGLRSGFGDELLRLGHLKVFMDGALASGTANLIDAGGVELTSRAELEELTRSAASAGWPVSIHAIGDQANRDALDALEATQDAWRPEGLRPRIEHAQLLHPADIPRFAELHVACSVQFSHAPSDQVIADAQWAERLDGAYPYGSLAASGALLANGSDAPVEELDPLAGIYAGSTRTLDERPPWRPSEALTAFQALQATTIAPAWLEHAERTRGHLTPGALADLVVLSGDPLESGPDTAPVEVVATMLGGRWVHRPPPWD